MHPEAAMTERTRVLWVFIGCTIILIVAMLTSNIAYAQEEAYKDHMNWFGNRTCEEFIRARDAERAAHEANHLHDYPLAGPALTPGYSDLSAWLSGYVTASYEGFPENVRLNVSISTAMYFVDDYCRHTQTVSGGTRNPNATFLDGANELMHYMYWSSQNTPRGPTKWMQQR
jgi:hypothetical protein